MKCRRVRGLARTPSGSHARLHPDTLSQKEAVNTPCGCLLFGVSRCRCSDIDGSPLYSIIRCFNRSCYLCVVSASLLGGAVIVFCCYFSTLWLFFPFFLLRLFACRFILVCAFAFLLFSFSASMLFRLYACLLRSSVPPVFCFSAVLYAFLPVFACRFSTCLCL